MIDLRSAGPTGGPLLVRTSGATRSPDELDATCRQMESLFINELLSVMSRAGFGEGVLSGGTAGQVFTAQRNAALAEEMGKRGDLGLARMLYEELSQASQQHIADQSGGKAAGKEETQG